MSTRIAQNRWFALFVADFSGINEAQQDGIQLLGVFRATMTALCATGFMDMEEVSESFMSGTGVRGVPRQ